MRTYMTLGLDTSLTNTGIVLLNNAEVAAFRAVKTLPNKLSEFDDQERIDLIVKSVLELAQGANCIYIEGPAPGARQSDHRPHEVAGVVKHTLWDAGFSFTQVAPNTVKKFATGNGRADKKMMLAKAHEAGFDCGKNDNLADAYWIARLGYFDFVGL